jgi:hypothetical protein
LNITKEAQKLRPKPGWPEAPKPVNDLITSATIFGFLLMDYCGLYTKENTRFSAEKENTGELIKISDSILQLQRPKALNLSLFIMQLHGQSRRVYVSPRGGFKLCQAAVQRRARLEPPFQSYPPVPKSQHYPGTTIPCF